MTGVAVEIGRTESEPPQVSKQICVQLGWFRRNNGDLVSFACERGLLCASERETNAPDSGLSICATGIVVRTEPIGLGHRVGLRGLKL